MDTYICEYCGNLHDGSYGSGRFCSNVCARKFSNAHVTDKGREHQIMALNNKENRIKSSQVRKMNSKSRNADIYRENKQAVDVSTNNTGLVGKIGEISTIKKFLQNGVPVYTPVLDNSKVDLIAEFGGKPQRIQVKTSSRTTGVDNGATRFSLCSTGNIFNHGNTTVKHTTYGIDEIDYFALYDYNENDVYLVKNKNKMPRDLTLRHTKPANFNKNVNYASDYQIDRYLDLIKNGIDPENVILIEPIIFDQG